MGSIANLTINDGQLRCQLQSVVVCYALNVLHRLNTHLFDHICMYISSYTHFSCKRVYCFETEELDPLIFLFSFLFFSINICTKHMLGEIPFKIPFKNNNHSFNLYLQLVGKVGQM